MSDTLKIPSFTIGERMGKARDAAGLTQAEMAERLEISRRSIVRHEASEHPPRAVVLAYAHVTHVPEWWLLGETDDDTVTHQYWDVGVVIPFRPRCPGQLALPLVA